MQVAHFVQERRTILRFGVIDLFDALLELGDLLAERRQQSVELRAVFACEGLALLLEDPVGEQLKLLFQRVAGLLEQGFFSANARLVSSRRVRSSVSCVDAVVATSRNRSSSAVSKPTRSTNCR